MEGRHSCLRFFNSWRRDGLAGSPSAPREVQVLDDRQPQTPIGHSGTERRLGDARRPTARRLLRDSALAKETLQGTNTPTMHTTRTTITTTIGAIRGEGPSVIKFVGAAAGMGAWSRTQETWDAGLLKAAARPRVWRLRPTGPARKT